jgi:hypothetical protein
VSGLPLDGLSLTVRRKYFPPAPKPEAKKVDKAEGTKAEEPKKAQKDDKKADKAHQTEDDQAAALTDDEWVKVDESEIPKKASVEDGDEE